MRTPDSETRARVWKFPIVRNNYSDVTARSKRTSKKNRRVPVVCLFAGNRILPVMLKRVRPPASGYFATHSQVQGLAFLNHLK
jgi:hypothetical protein